MEKNEQNSGKLYYTIGEVAEMLKVSKPLLRFWEKEFDIITPRKSAKGTRYYSTEDIETIRLIYYLTKEKGLTLSGAKKKLKENRDGAIRNHEIIDRLTNIKEEIIAMRDELEPEDFTENSL
ncbi:MerR family transcriptional regulator [Coprobacter tertius]|uniref:MerR family transcriptional regulator n=1 Tax=Coprobacter tertius TaxID=2944915 RepID=A0ABT1MIY2_9BACT|nr:MerR family transcriptional regulator [Coprobacter tertius]MCP9612562.1 MerR family transcriptional regulator [Coprobacter tertius]